MSATTRASCFTREERDGLHVIFPIDGPMKQNCLLVNESVRFIFDRSRAGASPVELEQEVFSRAERDYQRELAAWNGTDEESRPRQPVRSKVAYDLYRVLELLNDHAIVSYPDELLRKQLLPPGRELPGSAQLMAVRSIEKTAAFLQKAVTPSDPEVAVFFSVPHPARIGTGYFSPSLVARRHLSQEEVYFVQLDARGQVTACTIVAGFAAQPASLSATFVAAAHADPAAFLEQVGVHFSQVCGLLSIVTLSAMIRFQVPTGPQADVFVHERFGEVCAELDFRKSFDLPSEFGPDRGLVAYDKTLF